MNHLYRAREIAGGECMPWVKVRVVPLQSKPNSKGTPLGRASLVKSEMWVDESMANWSDRQLKEVVFHELAHTYFKEPHTRAKTLMNPIIQGRSEKEIEEDFAKIVKKGCRVRL
jgi:predicted SprT family Zn-dependent metalloprotease